MVPCIPHPQKKTDLKDTDHCRLTFCVPSFGSRRFLGNQEEQLAKESEAKERHHLELAEDWAGRTRGAHVGVEGLWLPWLFFVDVTFIIQLSQNVGTYIYIYVYIYIYMSRFAPSETQEDQEGKDVQTETDKHHANSL